VLRDVMIHWCRTIAATALRSARFLGCIQMRSSNAVSHCTLAHDWRGERLKRSAPIERTRTFIGEHRNGIAHFNQS
jgi:hypothetical protein